MKTILIRISLIVAITAGVTVSALHVTQLKNEMTSLQTGLAKQTAAREKAELDLTKAHQEANRTAVALKRTVDAFETKSAEVSAQAERIAKLDDETKTLRGERDEAQAKLAAYQFSMTPEQVANAAKQIKALRDSLATSEQENVLLLKRMRRLESFLPISCPNSPITLPASLTSKVLAFDPKWRFVVLDAGDDQGVVEHAELLVSRGGRLVSKIRVKSVLKNRCIADVMEGWDLVEIMEGDRAIPADPRS